jgi:hypothetical protein
MIELKIFGSGLDITHFDCGVILPTIITLSLFMIRLNRDAADPSFMCLTELAMNSISLNCYAIVNQSKLTN